MAIRTNNYQELEARDRHILALVQKDAKLSQAEIAKRVGLSTAAVNERLRKPKIHGNRFLGEYAAHVLLLQSMPN